MTGPLFAGCDRAARASSCPATYFNPRTPCGVRPRRKRRTLLPSKFQSTHPLRGATSPSRRAASLRSNFNPRTPCGVRPGCTKVNGYFWYFNPRTPCGVRPGRWAKLSTCNRFQSTHPLRGATLRVNHDFPVIQISIHAPLAGCDKKPPSTSGTPRNFNPRTPCGVRLLAFKRVFAKKNISIHAPLAGCDENPVSVMSTLYNFNPRTPCGVRLR